MKVVTGPQSLSLSGVPGTWSPHLNAIARVLPHGDARFDRPSKGQKNQGLQDRRVWDALCASAMAHSLASETLGVGGGLVFA